MTSKTEHGYLVLADISGYTSYLARVELKHAQEILTDLLATIVEQFKQAPTISKLEGNAVSAVRVPMNGAVLAQRTTVCMAREFRRRPFRTGVHLNMEPA